MDKLKNKLQNLPNSPGCYKFLDEKGGVLYIGKAKDLKKRIVSYFRKNSSLTEGKKQMISLAADLDYIVVSSEMEALLLENTLIKKYKPKYNIDLKDDKNFVYIKISDDDFPKVQIVRKISKGKDKYFGPYLSGKKAKNILRLLKKIVPYRHCRSSLELRTVNRGELEVVSKAGKKIRPCLDFYTGRCIGPCTGKVGKAEYAAIIKQVVKFLKGDVENLRSEIGQEMKKASKEKNYERAGVFRDRIVSLNSIIEKQKVVSAKRENMDIYSMARYRNFSAVNLFTVRLGKLMDKKNFLISNSKSENDQGILSKVLENYYLKTKDFPKEIFVPFEGVGLPFYFSSASLRYARNDQMDDKGVRDGQDNRDDGLALGLRDFCRVERKIKLIVPKRGRKMQLLKMGEINAMEFLKKYTGEKDLKRIKNGQILLDLKKILKLEKVPKLIECYDISHLSGKYVVGAKVAFEKGEAKKSLYRKYKLKIQMNDDINSLKEVFARRFALDGKKRKRVDEFPDLIIIDGGETHLSSLSVFLNKHNIKIPMIGFSKSGRDPEKKGKEDIYVVNIKHRTLNTKHLSVKARAKWDRALKIKQSFFVEKVDFREYKDVLLFLKRVDEEAHRFAIRYFRQLRRKDIKK